MRLSRARIVRFRRLKVIFAILLTFSFMSVLTVVKGKDLLKGYALALKDDFEKQFNIRLDWGKIEGGVLTRLTVEDLVIHIGDTDEAFADFESIDIDISLLDVVEDLYRHPVYLKSIVTSPKSTLASLFRENIYFTFKDPVINLYQVPFSREEFIRMVSEIRDLLSNEVVFILELDNADIRLVKDGPPLEDLNGEIVLENSLILKELTLKYMENSVILNGDLLNYNKEDRLSFLFYNAKFRLDLDLSGSPENFSLEGTLKPHLKDEIPFEMTVDAKADMITFSRIVISDLLSFNGMLDLVNRDFSFSSIKDKDGTHLNGDFSDEYVHFSGKAEHLKVMNCDIISNIESRLKLKDDNSILSGYIALTGNILNYYPFKDIKLFFALKPDSLDVLSLEIGHQLRVYGSLKSFTDKIVDMTLVANNFDLNDYFGTKTKQLPVRGSFNGKIKVTGPLPQPEVSGKLWSDGGYVDKLNYNLMALNIKGRWPVMDLGGSRINTDSAQLFINGEVDMNRVKEKNFYDDLTISTDQKVIILEGWEIQRPEAGSSIKGSKNINEDVTINFKAYMNEETWMDDNREDELELEYKLKEDNSLKMKLKKDESFFGAEHKISF